MRAEFDQSQAHEENWDGEDFHILCVLPLDWDQPGDWMCWQKSIGSVKELTSLLCASDRLLDELAWNYKGSVEEEADELKALVYNLAVKGAEVDAWCIEYQVAVTGPKTHLNCAKAFQAIHQLNKLAVEFVECSNLIRNHYSKLQRLAQPPLWRRILRPILGPIIRFLSRRMS